jgi:arylsulfatase A
MKLFPFLLVGLMALASVVRTEAPLAAKPNIIFILSDGIAQGDLGCPGQKLIQTPNRS